MNPWSPPSEPPDTREEPECICPDEGLECEDCPAHGRRFIGGMLSDGVEDRPWWLDFDPEGP